ncbi:hypothetical protein PIB30_112568, partial [Stylosanthes scabra]|nr:hypothetical protein [Stylosanthes scabra]
MVEDGRGGGGGRWKKERWKGAVVEDGDSTTHRGHHHTIASAPSHARSTATTSALNGVGGDETEETLSFFLTLSLFSSNDGDRTATRHNADRGSFGDGTSLEWWRQRRELSLPSSPT